MRTMVAASWLLCLACAQTREAEDPSGAPAASEAPPAEQGQSEGPEQDRDREPAAGDQATAEPEKASAREEGRVAGGAEDPSAIPVASSPSGLMKPGAEQKVRDKLGVKAGGGSLRQALQKFQKEHDLPATGILDLRTVESLGLDPEDVFERANAQ